MRGSRRSRGIAWDRVDRVDRRSFCIVYSEYGNEMFSFIQKVSPDSQKVFFGSIKILLVQKVFSPFKSGRTRKKPSGSKNLFGSKWSKFTFWARNGTFWYISLIFVYFGSKSGPKRFPWFKMFSGSKCFHSKPAGLAINILVQID